jgi:hypothetical protein
MIGEQRYTNNIVKAIDAIRQGKMFLLFDAEGQRSRNRPYNPCSGCDT